MRLSQPLRENLVFMLAETSAQVVRLQSLLESSTPSTADGLLGRRGYSHNLKLRIQDSCLREARSAKPPVLCDANSLRAAEAIAVELDRLTDLVQDCALHLRRRKRQAGRDLSAVPKLLEEVLDGIELVRVGIDEEHSRSALKLGEVARRMSRKYQTIFEKKAHKLKQVKHSDDLMTALFVAHRLNEMGNVLLGIGEAILSARMGQTLHFDQFHCLRTSLEDLGVRSTAVETIAETKSGSRVSAIADQKRNRYAAVFKDGRKKKLRQEMERVKDWHEIRPGIAPMILSYRKSGGHASLLIEHLPGFTLEQIVLTGKDQLLSRSFKALRKTVAFVWRETQRNQRIPGSHMAQLRKRLPLVQEVHPDFGGATGRIGKAKTYSLDKLLDHAEMLEQHAPSPFSVFIHGDFNVDNILFDTERKRIYYIDLHRSHHADYTQDVSVLMVSNYRLQALDPRTRRRIAVVAVDFYEFARKFAREQGDDTFEFRLGLGLARSFISSTRFILDRGLAKSMYLRGCYLLERIREQRPKRLDAFRLPIQELFT